MPFTALLFSGGLDSVAMALILVAKGHEVEPVYCSHRHGGNVTKKEVMAASYLAPKITGRELVVVKAPTKDERWWEDASDQLLHTNAGKRGALPVPKESKSKRNQRMVRACREVGILDEVDHLALGILGVEGELEFSTKEERDFDKARVRDITHEDLERACKLPGGFLITPSSLGLVGKTDLLKAVGRGKRAREACFDSDSCLMYFNKPCGDCASCKARVQAFMSAWGRDETVYRTGTFAARHKRKRGKR